MITSRIQAIESELAKERGFTRRQDLFRELWHLRQKPAETDEESGSADQDDTDSQRSGEDSRSDR